MFEFSKFYRYMFVNDDESIRYRSPFLSQMFGVRVNNKLNETEINRMSLLFWCQLHNISFIQVFGVYRCLISINLNPPIYSDMRYQEWFCLVIYVGGNREKKDPLLNDNDFRLNFDFRVRSSSHLQVHIYKMIFT